MIVTLITTLFLFWTLSLCRAGAKPHSPALAGLQEWDQEQFVDTHIVKRQSGELTRLNPHIISPA